MIRNWLAVFRRSRILQVPSDVELAGVRMDFIVNMNMPRRAYDSVSWKKFVSSELDRCLYNAHRECGAGVAQGLLNGRC